MKNEILLEVWRNRDEFAKRCNNGLDVMVKMLQRVERNARNPLVDRTKDTTTRQARRLVKARRR